MINFLKKSDLFNLSKFGSLAQIDHFCNDDIEHFDTIEHIKGALRGKRGVRASTARKGPVGGISGVIRPGGKLSISRGTSGVSRARGISRGRVGRRRGRRGRRERHYRGKRYGGYYSYPYYDYYPYFYDSYYYPFDYYPYYPYYYPTEVIETEVPVEPTEQVIKIEDGDNGNMQLFIGILVVVVIVLLLASVIANMQK